MRTKDQTRITCLRCGREFPDVASECPRCHSRAFRFQRREDRAEQLRRQTTPAKAPGCACAV